MAKKSNVAWSFSRRSTFERCPLQYYFQYYGSNGRTAKSEPLKQRLRFLKEIKNRHLRTGDILHLVIRTYFLRAKAGKPTMDVNALESFACKVFQKDVEYSRQYPDGNQTVKDLYKYAPVLLHEYHNREAEADAMCQAAEDRMKTAIHNFALGNQYEAFRRTRFSSTTLVEHRFRSSVYEVPITGIVDLAFENTDEATVVDWKIGSASRDGSSSLQLAVYSLWASSHFARQVSSLNVCMAYLGADEIVSASVDENELSAVRLRILQDAELLNDMHDYGRKAIREAFTPCFKPLICSQCPFYEVCYA